MGTDPTALGGTRSRATSSMEHRAEAGDCDGGVRTDGTGWQRCRRTGGAGDRDRIRWQRPCPDPGFGVACFGGRCRRGAGAAIIPVPSGVRVWLAVGRTDMRKGMNGLALQVQQALGHDPHAGDLYVLSATRTRARPMPAPRMNSWPGARAPACRRPVRRKALAAMTAPATGSPHRTSVRRQSLPASTRYGVGASARSRRSCFSSVHSADGIT
jgi:hypothetical protein